MEGGDVKLLSAWWRSRWDGEGGWGVGGWARRTTSHSCFQLTAVLTLESGSIHRTLLRQRGGRRSLFTSDHRAALHAPLPLLFFLLSSLARYTYRSPLPSFLLYSCQGFYYLFLPFIILHCTSCSIDFCVKSASFSIFLPSASHLLSLVLPFYLPFFPAFLSLPSPFFFPHPLSCYPPLNVYFLFIHSVFSLSFHFRSLHIRASFPHCFDEYFEAFCCPVCFETSSEIKKTIKADTGRKKKKRGREMRRHLQQMSHSFLYSSDDGAPINLRHTAASKHK